MVIHGEGVKSRWSRAALVAPWLAAIACIDLPTEFPCAIDHTCPSDYECTPSGICVTRPDCTDGARSCNAACVDLQTDPLHCGSCEAACDAANSCCGGACKDTVTDVENCGSCDMRCAAGFKCAEGGCICDAPKTACPAAGGQPAQCVDIETDPKHCGSCKVACKPGAVCAAGACECPRSTTDCGDSCANLRDDVSNCGECGKSCERTGTDATCDSGVCSQACSTGRLDCDRTVSNGCEGQTPGGGACSIYPAACGCPAGQACVRPNATAPERCAPSGGLPLLATCTTNGGANPAPCRTGLVCVGNVCQPACESVATCDNGTYGKCTEAHDANDQPILGDKFCSRSCRPESPGTVDVTHQGCGPSQTCSASETGTTFCVGNPSGTIGAGQACSDAAHCIPGYLCVGSTSDRFCRAYCRIGQACSQQKLCTSFTPKLFDGASEMGFCPP